MELEEDEDEMDLEPYEVQLEQQSMPATVFESLKEDMRSTPPPPPLVLQSPLAMKPVCMKKKKIYLVISVVKEHQCWHV